MITAETNQAPSKQDFDVMIVALGYEQRSRFITETMNLNAQTKIALRFGYNEELSFDDNRNFFKERGFVEIPNNEDEIYRALAGSQPHNGKGVEIFVDISSMSKEMMALCLQAIRRAFGEYEINLYAAYAPSAYFPAEDIGPIELQGPVTQALSGWSSRPDKPVAAFIGLGNVKGIAIGAIQSIEPSLVWTFSAIGIDNRFDESVKEANDEIHRVFGASNFQYQLTEVSQLRRLVSGLMSEISISHRVVLVPLGPKVLSYACILTALFEPYPEASVWRFSSGTRGQPRDRSAHGEVIWHQAKIEMATAMVDAPALPH